MNRPKNIVRSEAPPVVSPRAGAPEYPIVLEARSVRFQLKCERCKAENNTSAIDLGRSDLVLLEVPNGWRAWLCPVAHGCPGSHWFLLCPSCAAEAAGNRGDFVQADRSGARR